MKYLYLQADSRLLLMHAVAILFNNSEGILTRRDKAGIALRALSLSGFLFLCNPAVEREDKTMKMIVILRSALETLPSAVMLLNEMLWLFGQGNVLRIFQTGKRNFKCGGQCLSMLYLYCNYLLIFLLQHIYTCTMPVKCVEIQTRGKFTPYLFIHTSARGIHAAASHLQ